MPRGKRQACGGASGIGDLFCDSAALACEAGRLPTKRYRIVTGTLTASMAPPRAGHGAMATRQVRPLDASSKATLTRRAAQPILDHNDSRTDCGGRFGGWNGGSMLVGVAGANGDRMRRGGHSMGAWACAERYSDPFLGTDSDHGNGHWDLGWTSHLATPRVMAWASRRSRRNSGDTADSALRPPQVRE